jgi:hypothetical protein
MHVPEQEVKSTAQADQLCAVVCTPSPLPLFLKLRIPKGLRACFSYTRILKSLATKP